MYLDKARQLGVEMLSECVRDAWLEADQYSSCSEPDSTFYATLIEDERVED